MVQTSRLGAALRQQRTGLGFSPEKLAAAAGIAAERVAALELGAPATTREIAKLAAALAVDPAALWRGDVAPSRTTARFRAPLGIASLAETDARLLAMAAEVGRIVAHLRSMLGDPPAQVLAWRDVRGVEPWPNPWDQGYKLGASARNRIYPSRTPIRSVQQLLEDFGVHVAWGDFETKDIIAASLYEPGAAPVILLNGQSVRAKSRLSRRAVLAHELCHILHDGGEMDLLTLISRGTDHTPNEQRANAFAPNFVVPGGWIVPHTTDAYQLVTDVATEWGLSFEGAVWHLQNANHISSAIAEELGRETFAIPEGAFEATLARRLPQDLGVDLEIAPLAEGALSDLALRAYEDNLISRGRAVELLLLK